MLMLRQTHCTPIAPPIAELRSFAFVVKVASATTDAAAAEQHPPPEPAEIAESVEPPPKRRKSCPVHKKRWEVCGCPQ